MHLSDNVESDLQQALSLGVTTVFDMFTGSTRFDRIKSVRAADLLNLADVRTAGVGATAPGGHPSQMGGPPFPTIADSAKAAAFVDARFAEGSDCIKIVYDDLSTLGMSVPMMDRGTLAGVIAAAHARGKLAVVHVLSEDQARTAIETGADGLVHLFAAGNVAPDFARIVAQHGAFVIPTLTLLFGRCGESNGASIIGLTDRGRIAPGFRADLVLVDGDPTTEIHATRRIVAIWKRGVPVRRVRYQDSGRETDGTAIEIPVIFDQHRILVRPVTVEGDTLIFYTDTGGGLTCFMGPWQIALVS